MSSFGFKEELLHYIWKFQKYDLVDLRSTRGESIQIMHPGYHNHHAGPDFLQGKVKIQEKTWLGSIEIHKSGSDWLAHKHQNDPAFANVILHVVFEDDKPIKYPSGMFIPTLELKNRIPAKMIAKYQRLMFNENWIACAKQIPNVDPMYTDIWLERMTTERLERKTSRVLEQLEINKNNWDQLAYTMMAQYLGLKVNNDAFKRLMTLLPFDIILKNRNLESLEALLFGMSGLVQDPKDDYNLKLQSEFKFLKKKYKIEPMKSFEWNFGRTRPANFPTLRIAQLAMLIHKEGRIFQKFKEIKDVKQLQKLLQVKASEYWDTHYRFGHNSKFKEKLIGKSTTLILISNVVVPLLFTYGIKTSQQHHKDLAIHLLQSLPSESNKIIKNWRKHGIKSKDAAKSQALLHLKSQYCDQFKCLQCAIGNKAMSLS